LNTLIEHVLNLSKEKNKEKALEQFIHSTATISAERPKA
jgi:hypothetical protein